jgi:hypothetical protein
LPGAPKINYLKPVFTGFIFCCKTLQDFLQQLVHAATRDRVIAGVSMLRSILFTAVISSANSAVVESAFIR